MHVAEVALSVTIAQSVLGPAKTGGILRRLTAVNDCAPYHTEQPTTPRWLSIAERAADTCTLHLAPLAQEPSA